ncbi:MAG: DNA topoisomerase VI subunit B [Euryarchaeota archaeon]|nr:DNA topoisomerase VI subunit B [Euryarchaeota archaeon]
MGKAPGGTSTTSITSAPIATELAKKQKDISVAEFFERNKHVLGFDSSTRSLITAVKEAVDNALDACEEASILPEVNVAISKGGTDELILTVEDNGPGIVKAQIPNVFGRLLYGSRFHQIRQSRGQQGIGISAVVMYANLTTGKHAVVTSKIGPDYPAYRLEIRLDTQKNRAEVLKEDQVRWDKPHGTSIAVHLEAKYQRGAQSVYEYLRSTAIVNPHAKITFKEPDGETVIFERATDQLPAPTAEIKPHPEGIELGTLLKMLKATETNKLTSFLTTEFSRVGYRTARDIIEAAKLEENAKPKSLELDDAKRLVDAFRKVKVMAPPTDCLSPIGELLVKKGLKKEITEAEFFVTATRPAAVYSGNPFQVEAGIAYGGKLNGEEQVRIFRFANRVPLMYNKGGCAVTHAVEEIDWRRYDLDQRGGKGIPFGPAVILVHVASTNVPFTSEAKEAVADIEVMKNEVQLALRECARRMKSHISKRKKYDYLKAKMELIRKILPMIAAKSAKIVGKPVPDIEGVVAKIMNNMMITDSILHDKAKRTTRVKLTLTNYTHHGKTFSLISVVPHGAKLADVEPKAAELRDGLVLWEVKRIPTGESRDFAFELQEVDADDFDETELYVKGIDEELVIGAEAYKEVEA